MLNFGKYQGIPISQFTSREMTEYLFWLRQSKYWGQVKKETKSEINKFLNYGN